MKRFLFFFCFIFLNCQTGNSQDLLSLGTGLRINGDVNCIEFDSLTNRMFIGGFFTQVDNVQAKNIAWHDAVGWHAFGSGTDEYISSLKFVNGKLFVGGNFSQIDGVPLNSIGCWDGSSWMSLGTGLAGGTIRNMEWYDSSLYVSGDFTSAGNQLANNIAHWDGNSWHAEGTGTDFSYVYLSSIDDTLYAYGPFRRFNGDTAVVERYDGTSWQPVVTDTTSFPYSICKNHDTLFSFNYVPALNRFKIMFADSGRWKDYLLTRYSGNHALLFCYHDTIFYIDETTAGTLQVKKIIDTSNVVLSASSSGNGTIGYEFYGLKHYGGSVYVMGFLNNLNDSFSSGIVKYDGIGWTAPFYVSAPYHDPFYNGYGSYLRFDSTQHKLLVSGKFSFAGDVVSPNIASWDGSNWHPMGDGLAGNDNATAGKILLFKDTLYVNGTFTKSGTQPVRGIAKWNGTAWVQPGGYCNGSVKSMTIYQDTLYVLGDFDTIGNIAAKHIAKYDGTTWWPVNEISASSATDVVSVCAAYGNLYLAGNTFDVGTTINARLAIYDGSTWTVPSQFLNNVRSLRLLNDTVYATVSTSSVLYKYNGTTFSSVGYTGVNGSLAYPSLLQNNLVVGDWDIQTTVMKYNGSWKPVFKHIFLDCMDIDSTSSYVTGYFPHAYVSNRDLNNIGILVRQPPVVSFTSNPDSICDHEYVFFNAASSDLLQEFEWNFSGGTPNHFTVQNPIVHYVNPGDFDVYYKVSNAFGSDSVFLSSYIYVGNCTVPVIETIQTSLEIFPNPFTDHLQLNANGEKILNFTLADLSGKILLKKDFLFTGNSTIENIATGFLSRGIYFMTVQSGKGLSVFKLIKL